MDTSSPGGRSSSDGGSTSDGGSSSSGGSSSGGGSSGSGSSSGGAPTGGEVVVVPCNMNAPGVTTATSYPLDHSLIFTVTGTCGLFAAGVWDAGGCGNVESAPQYEGGVGTGPVGNDVTYQFATPGPCGEDSGLPIAPTSPTIPYSDPDAGAYPDPLLYVAGPDDASAGDWHKLPTAYVSSHSYEYIWVSPGGPVTFWVNNAYGSGASADGVYGALQITIVDESAK